MLLLAADAGCGDSGETGGSGGAGGEPSTTTSTTGGVVSSSSASSSSASSSSASSSSASQGGGGASEGGGGANQGGGGASEGGGGADQGGGGAGGDGGAGGEGGSGGAGGSGGQGGAGGAGGAGGGSSVCTGHSQGGSDVADVVLPLPDVLVTTIAGSDLAGTDDGAGAAARFNNPVNLLSNGNDGWFVSDFDNGRVRVVDDDGNVTTLTVDPFFARPFGLVMSSGELLVQTDYNELGLDGGPSGGVIWGIDLQTGVPQPIATQAGRPRGLARLPSGLVVATDIERHDVRLFDSSTGTFTPLAGLAGCPDFTDAPNGADARFNRPYGVVVLANGNVLVADQNNHRIRHIALPSGAVTTWTGDGTPDMVDGLLANARFNMPQDLAIDTSGNVYVTDIANHRVRRISSAGVVETVAGGATAGFADGDGETARFNGQEGIEVSPDDDQTIVVADGTLGDPGPFHRIRRITLEQ